MKDDPATSPYAIWSEGTTYLAGHQGRLAPQRLPGQVVDRGDLPDDAVLERVGDPVGLHRTGAAGRDPDPDSDPARRHLPRLGLATRSTTQGERVMFEGLAFEAKWWTQGDSPEAASSNPDSSPWEPLTQDEIDQLLGGDSTTK